MMTIFEKSKQGRSVAVVASCAVPAYKLEEKHLSNSPANLPEVSEIDVVRHYTELSTHAFGVDNGFYPLGSCTMKYNPKVNEVTASMEGFAKIHPLQEEKYSQGALKLMHDLSKSLCEINGMTAFTLQPAAGAQGEYTGLKMIKKYHEDRGDFARTKIIVPDSAHGTNPASAALCGLETVNIPSCADGSVDLDALQAALDENVAGLMLTNPSTLGLFEKNIKKIADMVHEAGGLLYYDGANLNAIMGIVRPGDMGFDVVHLNLHKTFSTPHGGGGPGAGPVGCNDKLKPFLPYPVAAKGEDGYFFSKPEKSIGKVKAFYGNFLVLVRAYTYILTLGREGIKDAAEKAVLNANYLKSKLSAIDSSHGKLCMHEFVVSLEKIKAETGVSALDVAKAMIDIGIHPPTMYFPLIVPEALMFEPTETETKETLDGAAEKILDIVAKAYIAPDELHAAPQTAYIGRPDEVLAARKPVIKFEKDRQA